MGKSGYETLISAAMAEFDLNELESLTEWIINTAIKIQQIPAPTFEEEARARFVMDQFRDLSLDSVTIDERFNVYGYIRGQRAELPALMISAHTDTVFDRDVDLTIRRESDRIYGPGLGDNSLGVAGMLGLARLLRDWAIHPPCDLVFVATSGEEGLGDLCGMRMAFDRLKDRVGAVINLEGLAYGFIYNAGIAVRRFKIEATAEGGHSWVHFGRESAIHGLIRLGQRILEIQVPESPRTTYNIGMVEGGISINTIAPDARMWLDMRSEDGAALAELEGQVRRHIDALQSDSLQLSTEIVSDRPPGRIEVHHPLAQLAACLLDAQGTSPSFHASSTDGNIPLSHGCPTVTIGITVGGNAHRLDEYAEIAPICKGFQQLLILTQLASNMIDQF
jgi:tripeptide aminopeptidase